MLVLHISKRNSQIRHDCSDLHVCVPEQGETMLNLLVKNTVSKIFKIFHGSNL